MRPWKQYSSSEIHKKLFARSKSKRWDDVEAKRSVEVIQIGSQAIFCPYYVPLEGKLGYDWGVIVNPESTRFGLLTFEHDDCGCPKNPREDAEGWGRHEGAPNQEGDMWDQAWYHRHDIDCGYGGDCYVPDDWCRDPAYPRKETDGQT